MVLQSLLFLHSRVALQELDASQLAVGLLLLPVSLVLYHALIKRERANDKYKKPYRPSKTLPFFENLIDAVSHLDDNHDWMTGMCKEAQGQPILLKSLGQPPFVLVTTPELIEDVQKTQFEVFPKGEMQCEILGSVIGDGIIAVDGAKWVHQRKTASHLFTARSLRDSMTVSMRKYTTVLLRVLDRAREGGHSIDLFKLLNRFTMEAFAEIGFGIQMDCLEKEEEHPFQSAFDSIQRTIVLHFILPGFVWKLQALLGIGAEGRFKKDLKVIDDTVLDIIAKSIQRRQDSADKHDSADLVSLFLDHYESSPENKDKEFDPRYLRDIVVTFMIAGRDTTAQALSWFFVALTQHPYVAEKIREEVKRVVPDLYEGKIDSPSMEQAQLLTYLEAALRETLRLYPSVPMTIKSAAEDAVLCDGTFVRKGSRVGMPIYAMGRMTYLWGPDAEEFKPERWIDPATGKIIHVSPYKFLSFNAGPRMCLGMNLALLEMKIVASSVLSRFDIEVLKPEEVKYDFSLTLPIRGELQVNIHDAEMSNATRI
ncbi:hypothetical protein Poli38472_005343 [Pythium oligandrum]|uniref:Cytochrome P450 n=1 Tax=Pythium oligandrum TaxID=41045 RepID=A0A8K1CGD1_PYTOL|nr:hypothetical protein Poli38472_005343 [Pythium oligandrum]|eukprot:TMW62725.1 hypothetical protein Poli38472_005343 [Pythium oligandrum]